MYAEEQDNLVVLAVRYGYSGPRFMKTQWRVGRAVLEKQPRWDGISDKIPLSTEKACAIALADVSKRFPQVGEWFVETVTLRNLIIGGEGKNTYSYPNVWCYEITYVP